MTRRSGPRPSSWLAGAAVVIVAAILLFVFGGGRDDAPDPTSESAEASEASEAIHSDAAGGLASGRRSDGGASERARIGGAQPLDDEPRGSSKPPAPTPVGTPIRLRILNDVSSKPIPDAEVSVLLRGPARTASKRLRTNDDGIAVLMGMPPGVYASRIKHAEHLSDHRNLRIAEAKEGDTSTPDPIEIRLVPGASLVGRVVDLREAPIARTRLTLTRSDLEVPQRYSATSGEEGVFRFAGLGEGAWTLTASHGAYRSVGPVKVDVPLGESLTVHLADASPVTLRVLDPDGSPLARARVEVEIQGLLASSRLVAPTLSDDAGNVQLRNLPSDPPTIIALEGFHAEYPNASLSTTIEALDAGDVEIRFAAGREARGRVVYEDGNPAPDAHVQIDGPKSLVLRSTSSGEFWFRKFPPGEYTLRATTPDRGVSTALVVDLSTVSAEELELRLEAGDGTIAGRIIDADSVPMALVVVALEGEGRKVRVATDRDGRFRFAALPEGEYRISAGGRERGYKIIQGVRTGREDLSIRLITPGSIRGRIEATGPAPGYSLRLVPTGDGHGAGSTVRNYRFTSRTSSFHLQRVPAGAYRLELKRSGEVVGTIDTLEVPAGETLHDVTIVDEERAPDEE